MKKASASAIVAKDSDDESGTSTDTYEDDDDGDWDEVDRSVVLDDDEFREQMTVMIRTCFVNPEFSIFFFCQKKKHFFSLLISEFWF